MALVNLLVWLIINELTKVKITSLVQCHRIRWKAILCTICTLLSLKQLINHALKLFDRKWSFCPNGDNKLNRWHTDLSSTFPGYICVAVSPSVPTPPTPRHYDTTTLCARYVCDRSHSSYLCRCIYHWTTIRVDIALILRIFLVEGKCLSYSSYRVVDVERVANIMWHDSGLCIKCGFSCSDVTFV